MKLINSIGPNPKVVRMYMAERGISLETLDIDLSWPVRIASPDYLFEKPQWDHTGFAAG